MSYCLFVCLTAAKVESFFKTPSEMLTFFREILFFTTYLFSNLNVAPIGLWSDATAH